VSAGEPSASTDRPGVVLHNDESAPPALLGDWLRERGIAHRTVRTWASGVPDDPGEFAWVAALGASDSATQREPAWIPEEIEFLRRAIDADVPVLGICFGAQALSLSLGGEVTAADRLAWGWLEIETDEPGLIAPGPWVHFNYEIFSVPAGATLLARSPAGPGAFRLGPHLGVQFHPEVTPSTVERWAESRAAKLAELGIERGELRAQGERFALGASEEAFGLFDAWRRAARQEPGASPARR
jgi:GMP synthase-like glutamine amidotransferase